MIEKIKLLRTELLKLDSKRRKAVGDHVVSELMTMSELHDSLWRNKIFGGYNGKYIQVNDKLKVHIERVFKTKDGKIIHLTQPSQASFPLICTYDGDKFVKNGFECMCSDYFFSDMIKYNGWSDDD